MQVVQVKIIKTFLLCLFTLNVAFADDHCDDRETYPNINPSLVLCPVHAYNSNLDNNPESTEETEQMKKIIAMKTTVMTQQMKKQYDFLESTLKRFKIQLEKSILLNNMQANGAITEESSNKNIVGVEKCRLTSNINYAMMCLENNLGKAEDLVNNGKIQQAKRILEQDKQTFIGLCNSFDNDITENYRKKCSSNNKQNIEECITLIRSNLIKINRQIETNQTNNSSSAGLGLL